MSLPVRPDLSAIVAIARAYARDGKASATRRAYATGWAQFEAWAEKTGLCALPAEPQAAALFLAALAADGKKPSTIALRLAAIVARHRDTGHPFDIRHPSISEVMAGIRRAHGVAQDKKTPILSPDLRAMIESMPDNLPGIRDSAVILIGYGGALRRSELAALDVGDVVSAEQGLIITLRSSKTDQEGHGDLIAIHRGRDPRLCASAALASWLDASGIDSGPLFRPLAGAGGAGVRPERLTEKSMALIVKRAAARIGLDPDDFAAHSLRAGLATSAALAGADLLAIMRQTRHKSVDVARGYVRIADIWRDNVTARVL